MGINRNIVECKVCIPTLLRRHLSRINRNIVECKVVTGVRSLIAAFAVLIETLWNVKDDPLLKYVSRS